MSLQSNVTHLVYFTNWSRQKREKCLIEKLSNSLDVLKLYNLQTPATYIRPHVSLKIIMLTLYVL